MPTREKRAKKMGVSIDALPDGRGKHRSHVRGSAHHKWNHARLLDKAGYVLIRVGRSHALADPNGYAFEHHLIWVSSGGKLWPGYVIHHVNGDRQDNRIENLRVITIAEHNKIHNVEKGRDGKGRFVGKKAAGRMLDGRTWEEFPG